jgi:hypothetical protein
MGQDLSPAFDQPRHGVRAGRPSHSLVVGSGAREWGPWINETSRRVEDEHLSALRSHQLALHHRVDLRIGHLDLVNAVLGASPTRGKGAAQRHNGLALVAEVVRVRRDDELRAIAAQALLQPGNAGDRRRTLVGDQGCQTEPGKLAGWPEKVDLVGGRLWTDD